MGDYHHEPHHDNYDEDYGGDAHSEERAAAEGVQVEEAEEGRLHRRGVQEGHSVRELHHATQEGDKEAARDGNHG